MVAGCWLLVASCGMGSRGATVSVARENFRIFEQRVEMDEELSHGGDHGALVGFTSGDEPPNIRGDDGVVLSGSLRRHVENVEKFHIPAVVALNRFTTDLANAKTCADYCEACTNCCVHICKIMK